MPGEGGNAWGDAVHPPIEIARKPRNAGLTMVIDKGLGISAFTDLLSIASEWIDFIKLGFGTSLLYPPGVLRRKVDTAHQYGVEVYPGGTLLEIAELQGTAECMLDQVCALGICFVEVSEGTIPLSSERRHKLIQEAKKRGLHVISEIGKKQKGATFNPDTFSIQVADDLEAGAERVIVEGRDSGKGVGIYDNDGQANDQLVHDILAGIPNPNVLIWEAPLVAQQQRFLLQMGANVNLGNVQPEDVVTLAATRAGVRGDTFRLVVEQHFGTKNNTRRF